MWVIALGVVCAAAASLFFSTVSLALQDFSRTRLEQCLARHRRTDWLEKTVERRLELISVTSAGRLLANMLLWLLPVWLMDRLGAQAWVRYTSGLAIGASLGLFCSIVVPMVLVRYAGEAIIAMSAGLLHGTRAVMLPVVKLTHLVDRALKRLLGTPADLEPEQVEKEILSAVEEGEKEGVVGTEERQIIESVIEFRDAQVGQVMTARPEIVAVEVSSSLEEIKQTIVRTGHSRLPVYEGTLDNVLGVLYARDLLQHLGRPPEGFDVRSVMRPAVFVPETKPLRDLLQEFRHQKVHVAIVLDEYGGTAGLVTIEDVLEELIGEISDEHEPVELPMFQKLNESAFELDARVQVEEANRLCGLNLPEDAGFETVGGYVLSVLGRVPVKGTVFEQQGVRFTVLDAEPQRIRRLKVESLASPDR